MSSRKSKRTFSNPLLWGAGIVVILLILLAVINGSDKEEESKVLTAVTNDEVSTFLEHGESGFLYVGRPTCPFCREFMPVLEKASQSTGQTVYYYNTDEGREQDEEKLGTLLDRLKIESVPALLYIENGEEADRLTPGTIDQEAIAAFLNRKK
ncbi:thioredoxin family protein [Paenibacillus sp. GYB006]|uniref:thioredoxin family protein n=1 Tax=Paenibacillus sp. GYB006 TaxID=2994394 RepID=UPI002F962B8D